MSDKTSLEKSNLICKDCGASTKDNPWNTGHCLKHWKALLNRFKEGGGTVIEF